MFTVEDSIFPNTWIQFLEGIAISNQMAMTGVTHFSSCDITDREGKLRTNEFRLLTPCLGVIAISNQVVIIHSLFG